MTRTDNDTWDLATSVGATATMVAAARAIATNADEPLINDQFAEPLVRAVGVDFLTKWASGEMDPDQFEDDAAGWGLRYMPYAMAARTQFFDAFFADAAERGIRQAVILASGLDSRAYRLEWPAGTTVYEIDQPQVIAFKRTTLSRFGAFPTTDLKSLAVDLRDDWVSALTDAGFDPNQPSAWIAEGLFGYLPPEAQDKLLDAVTELSAPGSMIGVEAVPHNPDADYAEAREKMREATEKWRDFGFDLDFAELTFEGERHDVAEYLDARGWRTDAISMSALLTEKGYPAMPQVDGAASMADVQYTTSHRR
ncbi:SAM-dependent methyltransferase [Mycolicibacterium arenosum]|uniref:S-adenosyl-L-methionine-dependent methyltransferase n=1 Tax=Mycolicibacterium arenosum TaxID=2952157 RepID=A0ABT1M688_9MYCO|nr:class I SAM-dependent methyltransferase [Mycolicibacterium sp. CAU 1645]MCP9274688.1 class I SAM-dependent methyltransferase [Mycolicibacterium sp. CAU 1645]